MSIRAAFERESERLCAELAGLDEADYRRPSNCPPWDLRELVVHVCFSAFRLPSRLPAPEAGAVEISAADYYRRAARNTSRYRDHNVARTRRTAEAFATGAEAAKEVEVARRETGRRLRDADAATSMAGPAGVERDGAVLAHTAIRLSDFVITRVIAASAHSIDVAITLGRDPWATAEALAVTTPTLLELEGESSPPPGCGELDFLMIGTGRRQPSTEERNRLGSRAERYPLLS